MQKVRIRFFLLTALLTLACLISPLPASAVEQQFCIVHTSDEHSALMPSPLTDYLPAAESPATGGFARLSTIIHKIRDEKPEREVLILSSGDFIGGSPFSWLILASETAELEMMRRIGYSATILGNHEFDYGPQILADYFCAAASQPQSVSVINSHLVIPSGHAFERVPIRQNKIMELKNGLKVGLFGLLGKGAYRLSSTAKPLSVSDQHLAAQNQIKALRNAGAEVIIALTHAGLREDEELARAVSGIHLILGGHDHIRTDPPRTVNNTIIMHSGYYLKSAGRLELSFNATEDRLQILNQSQQTPFIYELNSQVAEDPEIAAMVRSWLDKLNQQLTQLTDGRFSDMSAIIARSDFSLIKERPFSENQPGNFITDAMRLEVEKLTGDRVHLALHANGTIRGNIIASSMESNKGNISFMDLASVSGLGKGPDERPGHPLVSLYLTGHELRNLLEIATLLPLMWGDVYSLQVSGIRYRYDPARAFWFKIPFLNKPLPAYSSLMRAEIFTGTGPQTDDGFREIENDDSKLYHLVTTHYLATYLPMVGARLPRLNIVLKDKTGKAVELDQTIIRANGREFKIWEAVAQYAMSFAADSGGISSIPDYYRETGKRIIQVDGPSLWLWPSVFSMVLAAAAIIFLYYRRSRRCKTSDF